MQVWCDACEGCLCAKEAVVNISDIRIRKVEAEGSLKAYVTVTFDDAFVVHNVKVIKGEDGFFIAMPSRKTRNGVYKDVAHPINREFRQLLQDKVLDAYGKLDSESDFSEEENL